MATSKQSFVRATEPQCSASSQREEETRVKAPLTTMYVHSVPAPGLQPYPQAQPGALQDTTVVPLFLPRMCSNSTLPSLTLRIASGAVLQQQRLVAPATSGRPKSVGKHICPQCGKDCLKPSVLEKHLRCHTGERPYPCTTCGISFKTQSNLYKHKRTQAHARLSSESDKGTFSSQESTESSKDNCTSPSCEMNGGDSADMKRGKKVLPVVTISSQVDSKETKTMSIEWALRNAAMVGLSTTPALQDNINSLRKTVELSDGEKNNPAIQQTSALSEDGCTPLTPNRMPLQRQEALFSKPWDSPMSRGKSQSHDSTDSGFSDSSEHHSSSSPGASLHYPSMESLTETTMEQQEPGTSQTPSEITSDPKCKVSIQEKQRLEERILKLIYENSVLVDNKQLETVRPRKTILSKQGSIDLPVPYTYKDSFHFEIKSSKHSSSSQNQDGGGGAIHSPAPTQHSTGLEHAPLTRSSSLPFPMGGKPTDGTMNLNLSRRCSAGHVYPLRSSDQQAPGHRSLVRQVAVDCLPTAEVSLVERGSISSLSSDGDSTDVGTEPTIKGNHRKKARKFDYTKWHTYRGGTFTKLYSTDKESALKAKKTTLNSDQSLETQISQQKDNGSMSLSLTSCSILTLQSDLKVSNTSFENHTEEDMDRDEVTTQHTDFHIPSERKKQRTGSDMQMLSVSDPRTGEANENLHGLVSQLPLSTCATYSSVTVPPQKVNMQNLHPQGSFIHQLSNPSQLLGNTLRPAFCFINVSGTSGTPSGSISSPTVPEAKSSFPPKYQLKIPCSTDGVSASCSGSALALSTCSDVPDLRQSSKTTMQCHLENSGLPSKQCQGVSIVTTFDQSKQDVLCATNPMPILSLSCSQLNQTKTSDKTLLTQVPSTMPTSISVVSPPGQHPMSLLQRSCATCLVENLSTGSVSSSSENTQSVTAMNTSAVICGSESGVQTCSSVTMTPTVHNHPASPVNESVKPLTGDTNITMYENTLKSMVSKMATDDFQGSQSEEKMMLLNGTTPAQNTFYVRTADLQIVMQLISDEQLALIEPHIETTTSSTVTNQTTLSQEVYSNDVTHVYMAQEMVNNADASKKKGYNCESASPTNKAEIVCNLNSQKYKSSTNGSPWSHPQTKVHISASVDSKKKSTGQLYEPQKIPENSQKRKSAGFEVTSETRHKLVSGDKLSEPSLVDSNYSRRGNDKEPQNSSVHSQDSDNSSEDQTFIIDTSTDKVLFCLMEPNHIQTTTNTKPVEPNETGHLMPVTLSENSVNIQTKTRICICEKKTSTSESHHMQKELSSTIQPSHNKPHWAACGNSGLDTREMRACDKCKLNCKHGNLLTERFCAGQTPTQYDFKQAFALGPGDFGNDIYGEVKASCPMLNRTTNILEDSSRCGDVHTNHANLEIFTGPGEDGTLKSLRRDPGRQSKNPESGGGEGGRASTEVADKNSTGHGFKDNGKRNNRKKDVASCEEDQTSAQDPHFPREVSLSISEPLQQEKFGASDNPEASVCTNMVSQAFEHQGQGECNNTRKDSMGEYLGNSASQEASQKELSSPKYSNQTCRHLLVHPLKVNTKQNEFQKETQSRGPMSYWIYSKDNQVETSKHDINGIPVSASILQNNCGALKTKTVNASIGSSCSAGPSSHQELHTQICPPAINSNPTYLGISSYLEHEDSNSSSDDEQKLVIELE